MTPRDALIELLARLGAGGDAGVVVTEYELSQWPSGAVAAMKSQRLITKARPASSAVCPGCERECVMPIHVLPDPTDAPAAFVVCDKRSDINRVTVPISRLEQWQCSADAVIAFVAECLGLGVSDQATGIADLRNIGIARGDKRSQMLCLRTDGKLDLVAGTSALPMAELIEYDDGRYSLDGVMLRQLVDSASTADKRYTPSTAKREVRKLNTHAMYAHWQKAYRELKRKRRGMSDVWYARQIARTDIAQGRDADTIRKHMKK